MRFRLSLSVALILVLACSATRAAVVINEFQYDDTGTADDREFVELYNDGGTAVDISGWTLGGRDPSGNNTITTIPGALGSGTTTIAAGGYYVVGNTGVLNVNQTAAGGFLENDNETIELWNGTFNTTTLQDAVAYETNKGAVFIPVAVSGQTGPGVFGNNQGPDKAGTPLNSTVSVGRYINGRDTNNNGRDYGMRPSTPGTSNAPGGIITSYSAPDPTSLAVGSDLAGVTGSFVNAKVIDPTSLDANNLNAIPAPPGGTKAYSMWDPSGGGNGATSDAVFATTAMSFKIAAYLDTRDLPVQTNASAVAFRGSEITLYGLGGGDPLTNLTDISTAVGLGSAALPLTEAANGFTGLAWLYEKVGVPVGGGAVSEKLYLVDANDGGDSDTGGNSPLDWIVLTTIDLSSTASGWYNLGISVDASGNVVAEFEGQIFNHTTSTAHHSGAFNIGYRENLQNGADGTPDAIIRQATFTVANVPEANAWMFGAVAMVGGLGVWWRRQKSA